MATEQQIRDIVSALLNNNLPSNYYYHNLEHTLYVADKVTEIGRNENCTLKELNLLTVAALWHDAGFINTYTGHEEAGCLLVRQYLPEYGYTFHDIEIICGMIMATKMPQSPQNKLEEIIADADLEYLGTQSAGVKADDLFKELQHLNPALTKQEWDKMQISFLKKHHYFTKYCKINKEPQKQKYLNALLDGKN